MEKLDGNVFFTARHCGFYRKCHRVLTSLLKLEMCKVFYIKRDFFFCAGLLAIHIVLPKLVMASYDSL